MTQPNVAKRSNARRAALFGRPFDRLPQMESEKAYWFAGAAALAAAEDIAAEEAAMAASDAAEDAAAAAEAAAPASDAADSAAFAASLFPAPLQATTERAATAAPATRILRRASEVIVPGPLEGGCCADQQARPCVTARGNHGRPQQRLACAVSDYAVLGPKGKRQVHDSVINPRDYPSAGIDPSVSSSSRKLGCAVLGTLPRPISTEICAALPCRWATSTDWMMR